MSAPLLIAVKIRLIEDEHDVDDDSFIKALDDGCYNVKGSTPIEDFNEFFEAAFDDEEFDTIGGIVAKEFGHLPQREEVVVIEDYTFNYLAAGRCISADSFSISSARMIPTCAMTGQAAGLAAAQCVHHEVGVTEIDVNELQKELRAKGAEF